MPDPSATKNPKHIRAFEKLTITGTSPGSFVLTSDSTCAQIRVLREDLLRLRIARGRELSKLPSWAVVKTDWPAVSTSASKKRRTLAIQTSRGQLILNLADGRWELKDHLGLVLFAAGPGATEFTGTEARVVLSLQEEDTIFGLGETTGTFNKRGLIREFWNTDVGGVRAGLRSLYLSIPFAIAMRQGRAAGLFWDNPARQTWDMGQTNFERWKMSAADGEIDLYFFLGPTCSDILERYTELTGRMPLPPAWGLGYQQCRYSYETRERVEEIARTFRGKRIPCDALYLDIHYMRGYRVFTFGKGFPKPREMLAGLANNGFKVVTIVDPGVKDDPRFAVLQHGIARHAFIKAPDGQGDYLGQVWPGRVRFPDFLNARTRAWWGQEQARFQKTGVAGFWNDMNEPADFSAPNKGFPGDCLHQTDVTWQRHAAVHNVYGSQMARASFEGALAGQPNQRPFIITRAGYAGLQKYAVAWTGDNASCWEQLADSVQMLLNLSLSGVAFCGADVGGFHDNTTGELLARWMQLAAFTPFFRNHSNLGTIDQEPWAFGPKIEAICRRYIGLRYQLMPYLYGLFLEAHRRGTPIIRPLFWHYPNDPASVATSDQFMLGRELIIAPMLHQGAAARSVYLPAGIWFNFWTGEVTRGGRHVLAEAGLETLPIFVRSGAILPMIPVHQFVGQRQVNLVNLHIWPGSDGELDWYEDDGVSLDYQDGAFHGRRINLAVRKRTNQLEFGVGNGSFPSAVRIWRVVLRNASRPASVKIAGQKTKPKLDADLAICAFEVPNRSAAFDVVWR